MNSLVLKPWRWVVFLGVGIPGKTPSPAALRLPATLAAGAPRAEPREACGVRRATADFLVPRLPPAELFFVCADFPATADAWIARPLARPLGPYRRKIRLPTRGARRRRLFFRLHRTFDLCSTFLGGIKALWRRKTAMQGLQICNFLTRLMPPVQKRSGCLKIPSRDSHLQR